MNYSTQSLIQINLYIIFFLILIHTHSVKAIEKILFKVNNISYTSIDIKNRIIYLKYLDNRDYDYQEVYKDLLSIIIFNEHAKNQKLIIKDEIIKKYLENISDINDKNIYLIKNNLLLDLQRKNILEKLLKKNKRITKKNNVSLIDIYNISVEYFSINNKFLDINSLKTKANLNNIKKTKMYLNKNNINFQYIEKKIENIEKIDPRIKIEIKKFNDKFMFKNKNFIIMGNIKYNIKKNINPLFLLYQFNNENYIINQKNKCENLENNSKANLKKFEYISINKLNDFILNNIVKINDYIEIENNKFIILCDIKYDKTILQDEIFYEKFNDHVKKIENDFIAQKLLELNYFKYE